MTGKRSVLRQIPRWVWLVAFLPGMFAQVTNLGGMMQASEPDRVFVGARHQPRDFAVYMSTARYYGETGERGAPNLFVTDAQDGRMVMSYLWLVGQISEATGLGLVLVWRLLGLLSCWIFFLLVWVLARRLLPDAKTRDFAFLLACFSGGLEWLLFGLQAAIWPSLDVGHKPLVEFWNWSSMGSGQIPMWCAGHALFIGALLLFLNRKEEGWKAQALRPFFMAILLVATVFVHPYTGLTAFGVIGVLVCWAWMSDRVWGKKLPFMAPLNAVVGLIMAGAVVASIFYWARQDPTYAKTMSMSSTWRPSYNLLWFPVMYGLPFFLAAYALIRRSEPVAFAGLWLAVVCVFTQLPFWPGVKFQYLVHLPMCLLAATGLMALKAQARECCPKLLKGSVRVLVLLLLFAAAPTHLMRSVAQAEEAPISYVPRAQLSLLGKLDALPFGAVMTSYQGGLLIPWKSGKPVFLGHWFMSYDFQGRSKAMFRFWSDETSLEDKKAFIKAQRIRYLVVDPWTREMGGVAPGLGASRLFINPYGEIWEVP